MMHCKVCGRENDGTLVWGKKCVCDFCLSIKIPCTCGCNQLRSKYDKWGYEHKYIKNHNKRDKHPSEESNKKNSESHKGEKGFWFGKQRTKEARQKMSRSRAGKIGPKSGNYKGGITPIMDRIRKSFKYKQWRQDVFERDGYTCQRCQDKDKRVNAHHHKKYFSALMEEIKEYFPLSDLYTEAMMYKPLWDLNNGITLCEKCHKKKHKELKLNKVCIEEKKNGR